MAAYRITARPLDHKLVSELVLREFASLEDVSVENGTGPSTMKAPGKVVLVLEDDEGPHAGAPRRPA